MSPFPSRVSEQPGCSIFSMAKIRCVNQANRWSYCSKWTLPPLFFQGLPFRKPMRSDVEMTQTDLSADQEYKKPNHHVCPSEQSCIPSLASGVGIAKKTKLHRFDCVVLFLRARGSTILMLGLFNIILWIRTSLQKHPCGLSPLHLGTLVKSG